jgi:hypothetical protein
MASRNSDGKRLSGAQERKRAKQRRELEAQQDALSAALDLEIGRPPEDTADLIPWASKGLAAVAYAAAKSSAFGSKAEQLRFLADALAKIGMLRDKTSEQQRIHKLAMKHGLVVEECSAEGLTPSVEIEKPATARRARKPGSNSPG